MNKIVRVNPQQPVLYQPGRLAHPQQPAPSSHLVPTEVVYDEPHPGYWQQQQQNRLPAEPYSGSQQYQSYPQPAVGAGQYADPVPGQMAYPASAQPLSPQLLNMLPPHVAAAIGQMTQANPGLASGIGQQQNYAYTDQQGRQINGSSTTQVWAVPISSPPMLPSASDQPQVHAQPQNSGPNFQLIGMTIAATGIVMLIATLALSLTRSQGYSDGLRGNPPVVQPVIQQRYPY